VTFAPSPAGGVTWSIAGAANTPTATAAQGCTAHRGRFPALIGKSEPEARAALVKMRGITTIRSGGPGMPAVRMLMVAGSLLRWPTLRGWRTALHRAAWRDAWPAFAAGIKARTQAA
jgi:hypothetical protein